MDAIYTELTPKHAAAIAVLATHVFVDEAHLHAAASDETEDYFFLPKIVVQPTTTEEVSKVLAYCVTHRIAVTPRGAGTGLSGGALPVYGGLVMDMQRMNRILSFDEENFQITVEPGLITQNLQEYVLEYGLSYPVDPASRGSCFIGGNVAENSGGPRAVKYGVVKDYVLNLEVVLPNGEVLWTGANTLKNATGYNLTQLVVGSEGTLCIVTKIVLRLIPAAKKNLLLLAPFRSAVQACEAVGTIMKSGILPSALEFMERDALVYTMAFVQDSSMHLPDDIMAHLLIEVDGNEEEKLMQEMEQIATLLEKYDIGELLFAESAAQKEALWQLRRKVGEAVKSKSIYKEEDTVVPRAHLPLVLQKVKELGNQYGFQSVCYGHAGDGNLHVNILKGSMNDSAWQEELPKAIRELFETVVALGGTISGEHGIGYVQKGYLDICFSATTFGLMRAIKKVFDPNGILNPGKIL